MFLPKSKYTIKHASWGQFYLSGSRKGESYVGPYIEDYRGRTFAGTDISKAEQRVLYPIGEEEAAKLRVENIYIIPTEEDYAIGSYTRYFRQNQVSKAIEEITEGRVDEKGPWNVVSGSWILTGSLEDTMVSGYPHRGVYYRNGQTLLKMESEMPGLSSALNLTADQFVQDL